MRNAWAADDLWALLKKPAHVVLLRHSHAPEGRGEPQDMNLKNCKIQRNLDEVGRAQARRIGDEFRRHDIQNVRLVSSHYCRTIDTAKLMDLGPVQQLQLLNLAHSKNPIQMSKAREKTTKFIKTIPARQVAILVTHFGNILAVAGVELDSGEMAIVHLDEVGMVVVDGRTKFRLKVDADEVIE